jgi:hypothetical protein
LAKVLLCETGKHVETITLILESLFKHGKIFFEISAKWMRILDARI